MNSFVIFAVYYYPDVLGDGSSLPPRMPLHFRFLIQTEDGADYWPSDGELEKFARTEAKHRFQLAEMETEFDEERVAVTGLLPNYPPERFFAGTMTTL